MDYWMYSHQVNTTSRNDLQSYQCYIAYIGDYGFAWAACTQVYTCTHVAYGNDMSV